MLNHQIIVGNRGYLVRETLPGTYLVEYRPINASTGQPWQAARLIARFTGERAKAKALARWLKETTLARAK